MSVCILISSCEKYRVLAEWTAARIDRCWAQHPPIFFSGLRGDGAEHLPITANERDWMQLNLDAVESLLERGFEWTYLILDDLPPVGRCHADYLNRLLPEFARKANLTLVSLLGWGQHRAVTGELLGRESLYLEKVPATSRWRYSLHPGFWNLAKLREILRIRCAQFAPEARTPWNFERHQEGDLETLPADCLNECYRVSGRPFVNETAPWIADGIQTAALFVVDVLLFLTRLTRGDQARTEAAARWLWPFCLYRGPYPIFWSGVMRQGGVSREWANFLKWAKPRALAQEWAEVSQKLRAKPATAPI